MICDGCGKPCAQPRCDGCVAYYRDLKRRAAEPACRCDGAGCPECEDRAMAIADAKAGR